MRRNNFDAIRLVLAFSVFLSHAFPISGEPSLETLWKWANSAIAVQCFFVISGFLIFMSYDRSRSLMDYFRRRALRIYPAYFAVVLLCAVFGLTLTILPWQDYLQSSVWRYLALNLTFLNFLQPTLPGVFATNPIPIVNGALWTIKVEVMFYVSVPIISWLARQIPKIPLLLALYIAGLAYRFVTNRTGNFSFEVQLPGQLPFFLGGAFLYFYQDYFLRYAQRLIIPAIVVSAVELYFGWLFLFPLSLSVIVIYLALCVPALNRFRPKWDLSYGYYIWHFPVLQVMTFAGLFRAPLVGILVSGVVTALIACLSWIFVERRFLKSRVPVSAPSQRPVVLRTQAQSTSERTV